MNDQTKLIHRIALNPKKRLALFRELSLVDRLAALRTVGKRPKQAIINNLDDAELVAILDTVDPDEATDLLRLLNDKRRNAILEKLSDKLKQAASMLLEFDPDTAAGLMTLDYIQVDIDGTIADAAEKFKLHEKRTGRLPVILAVQGAELKGFLPVHELGFTDPADKLSPLVKRVSVVHHAAAHDKVVRTFKTHPHNKVVVLNDDGSVLGIIYSDDVLRLMHEQEAASLYNFAGVSSEETVADSARRKIKFRYKWLIINLATSFLAAFTVANFEDVLSKYVLLAVYMPIVAGMGGNAATQTLAVMVRGIALRQIELRTALKTLKNEVGAGLANGFINGLLVALVVIAVNGDYRIAFILALAMVVNLLVAAFFGTLVPLVMSKLGKDPATSATIFITTATDVLGFLAFLGLATLILA